MPLVELSAPPHALARMQAAPAQAAIDRAVPALARMQGQALAGTERMRLAGTLLMQVRDSRAALTELRKADAKALLAQAIVTLRTQLRY